MNARPQHPIAIVGIGCRFPGASGPAGYWELLSAGTEAVRDVPPTRWDLADLVSDDPKTPGRFVCRRGGFLDDVSGFDWRALRMSALEAKYVDPQHRLLLEVAWEAFEDGGFPREALAATRTGVFVGVCWNDWMRVQARSWEEIHGYTLSGTPFSFAASRISYHFGLEGPSVALDTNCASALTALHLAARCLDTGEIDLAVAGGVNLMVSPDGQLIMSKAGVLSPTGRVRTLDRDADGFVRGEGAGLVLLKRLDDVRPDDKVYAVLRSVVVNHNGASQWIMAPSPARQEQAVREAWAQASVPPAHCGYVELHGTAFPKGDPVEVRSVAQGLGDRGGRTVAVGAVKSNIGNLESAAAVASVIKVALSLRHAHLPPTLHVENPNPAIPFEELGVTAQRELTPWAAPRAAGVNVTSYSGTNGHAVLIEDPRDHTPGPPPAAWILPISGHGKAALEARARAFLARLVEASPEDAADVCYTAAVRWSHELHRAAVVGADLAELIDGLRALVEGSAPPPKVVRGVASEEGDAPLDEAASLTDVAAAYVAGTPVDWARVVSSEGRRCAWDMPAMPWQRKRVWLDAATPAAISPSPSKGTGADPLLGACVSLADPPGARVWTTSLSTAHHALGTPVVPEGRWIAALTAAARAVHGPDGVVTALAFEGPAVVAGPSPEQQVLLLPDGACQLFTRGGPELSWVRRATARLAPASSPGDEHETTADDLGADTLVEDADAIHSALESAGVQVGGPARAAECVAWTAQGARVHLREASLAHLLVGTLDALFAGWTPRNPNVMWVPVGVGSARVALPGPGAAVATVRRGAASASMQMVDVVLHRDGAVVASLEQVRLRAVPRGALAASLGPTDPGDAEGLLDELVALRPDRREQRLLELVREEARVALGLDPDVPLKPQQRLFDLGLDSISAMTLRTTLQRRVGRTLSATVVFDFPTPAALAAHLASLVAPASGPEPTGAPAPGPVPAADHRTEAEIERAVADLTDAEAEALLAQALADLGEDV